MLAGGAVGVSTDGESELRSSGREQTVATQVVATLLWRMVLMSLPVQNAGANFSIPPPQLPCRTTRNKNVVLLLAELLLGLYVLVGNYCGPDLGLSKNPTLQDFITICSGRNNADVAPAFLRKGPFHVTNSSHFHRGFGTPSTAWIDA